MPEITINREYISNCTSQQELCDILQILTDYAIDRCDVMHWACFATHILEYVKDFIKYSDVPLSAHNVLEIWAIFIFCKRLDASMQSINQVIN